MDFEDQQYLEDLKNHFKILSINEKDDLNFLKLIWRRRYKQLCRQNSTNWQNSNDSLTEIESSYAFLKEIGTDTLCQIVRIHHNFFFGPHTTYVLLACISDNEQTITIQKQGDKFILEIKGNISSALAANKALRLINKAIKRLQYGSKKGTWKEAKNKGLRLQIAKDKASIESNHISKTFWSKLYTLLKSSSLFIIDIEGSRENVDGFSQVEAEMLLSQINVPPINEWISIPRNSSDNQFIIQRLMNAEPPYLAEYIYLLIKRQGIPLASYG